jgi:hypothetical protein
MKKCLPKITFLPFALLFSAMAYSQDKVHITGTVTGENDAPLAGVSVIVKRNSAGVTTDARALSQSIIMLSACNLFL